MIEFVTIFFVGIAGGLVGSVTSGGGLISIPLLLFLGYSPVNVIATTRIGSLAGCAASLYNYARHGLVHWRYVAILAVPSLLGGILGAKLLLVANERYVEYLVGSVLVVLGLILIFKKGYGVTSKQPRRRHAALGFLLALPLMMYAVMFGAAGGLIMINLMLLGFGLVLKRATATGMAVWVIGTAAASVIYLTEGSVLLHFIPPLVLGSAIGGYIGAQMAIAKSSGWLRYILGVIVFASAIKMFLY